MHSFQGTLWPPFTSFKFYLFFTVLALSTPASYQHVSSPLQHTFSTKICHLLGYENKTVDHTQPTFQDEKPLNSHNLHIIESLFVALQHLSLSRTVTTVKS